MITKWTSTEDIIIFIIKPHKSFSDTINQYKIAERYMMMRNEGIAPRKVRMIIEDLIENGCPIISTPHAKGGYCWGSREEEVTECVNRLRKGAAKIFIRARRLKRNYLMEQARNKNVEQLDIFEGVDYGNK